MKRKKTNFGLTLMLVLACVCAAFVFVGCEEAVTPPPAQHEHNYTEWKHTDTEHWRECPEDGAATEKSEHKFVDGKCECGLIDTREFGTVKGKITLHGGKNADDFGDVTVDFEGDDAIVSVDKDGNFTATHVTVGKGYDVTVSKEGYSSFTAAVRLDTKDQTVALTKPFALEYQRLQSWLNKNLANFDLSHMNDAEPFVRSVAQGDLGVVTRDVYGDVAVSVNLTKVNDDSENLPQKGALVKFEGDQYMILRIHDNMLLRWDASTWGQKTIENKNTHICDLSDAQKTKLESEEGIKLTLVRCGNALYTYLDDEFILQGTKILSEDFADDKVQVGFWEFAPKANKTWKFGIEEDVSEYAAQIPTYNVPDATFENGTVTFDKTSYKYGETATVTLKPDTDYVLSDLKVYGVSVFENVENNVYSFAVTGEIDVQATFVKYQMQDVEFTVSGRKMGQSALLDGTVTLTNVANGADVHTVTLTNGKATVTELITPGKYKVVSSNENYYESAVTLAKGATSAAVTLQYKCFDAWANGDLDRYDLTHMNDAEPYIGLVEDGDFGVITRDVYDDVSVSVWLTKVKGADDLYPNKGVLIKFEDGKYMILRIHDYYQGNTMWLRWDKTIWNQTTVENAETWICELNSDQLKKFNSENGIKLTLVRRGNMLYAFLDGEFMPGAGGYAGNGTRTLAEEYADDKVQVGFWEFAPKADKNYKFEISSAIPTFAVPNVSVENGTVTFDKTSYKFGETVKLTVTPASGYALYSLKVCGKEVKSQIKNNTYTFAATEEITVSVTFADYTIEDVEITVNGVTPGGASAPLTGTVTFTNDADSADVHTVTLTSGAATVTGLVTPGTYRVVFADANYCEGTLTLAKGATTAAVTLQYKRFEAWANGNTDRYDLSHMNDENPFIHVDDSGDFGVITLDKYTDVSVSLWVTPNNVNNSGTASKVGDRQGLFIKFADGKHVSLSDDNQYDGLYWNHPWDQPTVIENDWLWIDYFSQEAKDSYRTDGGIKLTLVRRGNMLYIFINDTYFAPGTKTLPAEYADDEVQVGFWAYKAKANTDWKFDITKNIPTFAAPAVSAENGTVTFDKGSYKFGETVTITVTPADDYILSSLTVCGEDVKSQVNNNTYTFTALKDITALATFAECAIKNVAVTVNYAKSGETKPLTGDVTITNAADANDTRTITLTNGKATVNGLITPGTYKVVSSNADYCEGTLTLAKGDTSATVTLQYKRFDAWANGELAELDLAQANDVNPVIKTVSEGNLGVITRDSYSDVSVSLWLTTQNIKNRQGVFIKFANGKEAILDGGGKDYWFYWIPLDGHDAFDSDYNNWFHEMTSDEKAQLDSEGGIKLTVVRRGNMLYTFLNDKLMTEEKATRTLPEEYADGEVQVGFFSYGSKENAVWKFEISSELPEGIPA